MKRTAIFLASFAATAAVCGMVLWLMILQADRPQPPKPPSASGPDRQAAARRRPGPRPPFQTLEPGLELAELDCPIRCDIGDSKVAVCRIDPARFDFRLLCASSANPPVPQPASQWCRLDALVAAINAGVIGRDGRTAAGLMQARGVVNNPRRSRDMAMLAFDRVSRNVALAQVADLDYLPFNRLKEQYAALIQGPRLVSARGKNVAPAGSGRASAACIAMDSSDRLLFILVRSPYTMRDLGDALIKLKIGLRTVMLTATGPEAQLFVNAAARERQFIGSYRAGVREDDTNATASPVANVIGLVRRPAATN